MRLPPALALQVLRSGPPSTPLRLLTLLPPQLHALALRASTAPSGHLCLAASKDLTPRESSAALRAAAAAIGQLAGELGSLSATVMLERSCEGLATFLAALAALSHLRNVSTLRALALQLTLPACERRQHTKSCDGGVARLLPGPHRVTGRMACLAGCGKLGSLLSLEISVHGERCARSCGDAWAAVIAVLPRLQQLRTLSLGGGSIDAQGAAAAADALRQLTCLRALRMPGTALCSGGCAALWDAASACAALTQLDLSGGEMARTCVSSRALFIHLQDVSLPRGVTQLDAQRLLRRCSQLTRLVTQCDAIDGSGAVCSAWPQLRALFAAGAHAPDAWRLPAGLTQLAWSAMGAAAVATQAPAPQRSSGDASAQLRDLQLRVPNATAVQLDAAAAFLGALPSLTCCQLHVVCATGGEHALRALLPPLTACTALAHASLHIEGAAGSAPRAPHAATHAALPQACGAWRQLRSLSVALIGAQLPLRAAPICDAVPDSLQHLHLASRTLDLRGVALSRLAALTALRLSPLPPAARTRKCPFGARWSAEALACSAGLSAALAQVSVLARLRELEVAANLDAAASDAALAAVRCLTRLTRVRLSSGERGWAGRAAVAAAAALPGVARLSLKSPALGRTRAQEVAGVCAALVQCTALESVCLADALEEGAAVPADMQRPLWRGLPCLRRVAVGREVATEVAEDAGAAGVALVRRWE